MYFKRPFAFFIIIKIKYININFCLNRCVSQTSQLITSPLGTPHFSLNCLEGEVTSSKDFSLG